MYYSIVHVYTCMYILQCIHSTDIYFFVLCINFVIVNIIPLLCILIYTLHIGNFRDVNQNRRLDVLLSPIVGDFNIRMFLSFVQADGYNPLTVATTNFKVPKESVATLVAGFNLLEDKASALTAILNKPFRIGMYIYRVYVTLYISCRMYKLQIHYNVYAIISIL